MIASAFAFAALLTSKPDVEEFSIDLFLVANNPTVIKGLDWLKDVQPVASVERALGPVLQPFIQEKRPFVLIDGGDCSAFPEKGKLPEGAIIDRLYDSYDSATESQTINGKTKTRVVARTESESTTIRGFFHRPLGTFGYVVQTFLNFRTGGPNKVSLAVQDLNSYKTVTTHGTAQDKESLDKTLLLSSSSIQSSKRFLKENKLSFDGICISAWGLSDPADPNFVSFPPEGLATHYKLFRKGGKWGIRFIEYLDGNR